METKLHRFQVSTPMSSKQVKCMITKNTGNRVRNVPTVGITTLTADLVCRDTPAMKFVLGSRKADGLKWASKARLSMANKPCVLRQLLVPNLKRLLHMLHHIE